MTQSVKANSILVCNRLLVIMDKTKSMPGFSSIRILPLSQSITIFEGIRVPPFIGANCLVREDFVQSNKNLSY